MVSYVNKLIFKFPYDEGNWTTLASFYFEFGAWKASRRRKKKPPPSPPGIKFVLQLALPNAEAVSMATASP